MQSPGHVAPLLDDASDVDDDESAPELVALIALFDEDDAPPAPLAHGSMPMSS